MAQTRPSAIVQRPDPERAVSECTVAELLTEVIERAKLRRTAAMEPTEKDGEPPWPPRSPSAGPLSLYLIAREFSLAVTLAEDCLTRHNKAVYMERGVFAITDAERIPEA